MCLVEQTSALSIIGRAVHVQLGYTSSGRFDDLLMSRPRARFIASNAGRRWHIAARALRLMLRSCKRRTTPST